MMALLHISRNLAIVYILKDAMRKLWDYKCRKAAAKYLARRVRWAAVSGVEAVRRFGRSLLKAKQEVLSLCRHRITIGPPESFNNTVRPVIHRACGIRDLDYPFLKPRQESLESDLPK